MSLLSRGKMLVKIWLRRGLLKWKGERARVSRRPDFCLQGDLNVLDAFANGLHRSGSRPAQLRSLLCSSEPPPDRVCLRVYPWCSPEAVWIIPPASVPVDFGWQVAGGHLFEKPLCRFSIMTRSCSDCVMAALEDYKLSIKFELRTRSLS